MSVKITICFYVLGTYGSPVYVRAYWRRRRGRKEFCKRIGAIADDAARLM